MLDTPLDKLQRRAKLAPSDDALEGVGVEDEGSNSEDDERFFIPSPRFPNTTRPSGSLSLADDDVDEAEVTTEP